MYDSSHTTLQVKLDWRLVVAVLLAIIAAMFIIWRPWQSAAPTKTITVRGEATVKAVPDMFQFQPVFQGADIKNVTALGNGAVAQLKKLGVKDSDIKTTVSAAPAPQSKPGVASLPAIYYNAQSTFIITATAHDKALAQKIADYLATTTASGQVTPVTGFSTDTRARLDLDARSKASSDAKQKAQAMAEQLGAKVGKVVSINEDNGYGIYKLDSSNGVTGSAQSSTLAGPTIEPGTDQVDYVFTVVFELN